MQSALGGRGVSACRTSGRRAPRAWFLVSRAALNGLSADERSRATLRTNGGNGIAAFALYAPLALAAFSFPFAVAILTTVTWVFWLVFGVRMKHV